MAKAYLFEAKTRKGRERIKCTKCGFDKFFVKGILGQSFYCIKCDTEIESSRIRESRTVVLEASAEEIRAQLVK